MPEPLSWTRESQQKRLDFLKEHTGAELNILAGKNGMPEPDIFQGNIEQYIGLTQVPTGVIGPLSIKGTMANGDFYVPLATSEGAL
ncbi:UNVERIFIED_CONTAM: 3-hydroxy-3-methylglutaryl-CoA reductase, partial [Salmonella enterica subsp. enterica serovar Weltevreden]